MDLRDDVLAVDDDPGAARSAQCHVEDGAVLRDVDLLAAEHRVDPLAQARLLGELQEESERLVGDAVLGVVAEESGRLQREALAAARIVRKQLPKVDVPDFSVVFGEGLPGGTRAEREDRGHRAISFGAGAASAASTIACASRRIASRCPRSRKLSA